VKILLSSAVAVTVAMAIAPAFGADMLPYTKAPVPTTYDWSGVYFGGHIGGGWDTTTYADPGAGSILNNCCLLISTTNNPSASTNANSSGFLGGGQVGWNYQIGRLVVGADFDWSKTSLNANGAGPTFSAVAAGTPFANETYSLKTNWTATSTATIGVARDRWMLFTKAGVAWANNNYGVGVNGIGGTFGGPGGVPFAFSGTNSNTVTGWTVGIGAKWAFADNWFLNLEYNYLDFGSKAQNINGAFTAQPGAFLAVSPAATFTPTFNQNISEVKLGVNYKFAPGLLFF